MEHFSWLAVIRVILDQGALAVHQVRRSGRIGGSCLVRSNSTGGKTWKVFWVPNLEDDDRVCHVWVFS